MNTFKVIIKKILETDNNIFSFNYKYNKNIDENCKMFFNIYLYQDNSIKNKFLFFYDSINNNLLKNKNEFINYFCRIQKIYKILNKFVYTYKYNKSKLVVNTDLCLNIIDITNKDVICIFHRDSKYLFKINDLINIINTSLTNNYLFFAEPLCIKNPYNNLPFLKSSLYNIYLFIKYKTYHSSILFYHFFQSNFNLGIFKYKNENLLRDYSISNYVYKSTSNVIIKEINYMINEFNNDCLKNKLSNNISINKDFPQDKLIRIMRPYVFMFIYSKYTLLLYKKQEIKLMLKSLLLRFNNYNPQFGRKKFKILIEYDKNFKKKIVGQLVEFDDNHIKLQDYNLSNKNFLNDHIICNYQNYFHNFDLNVEDDETQEDQYEDEEEEEEEDSIS
jgi:hypothetical protein